MSHRYLESLEENFARIRNLFSNNINSNQSTENRQHYFNSAGMFSDVDILQHIRSEDIVITQFDETNLSPVGYNLTFTKFIYSVNKNLLLKIEKNDDKENFCYVPPNDTVLILTNEAVWVSEKIAGTFHSKVGIVSKGFGHIGTTLDPNWEGPLLISINNPTKNKIKLVISSEERGIQKYKSFVTLIFYKMNSPTQRNHDNPPSRIDILKDKKDSLVKKWLYKDLVEILNKILNFESLQVGIGRSRPEDRSIKILEFRNKYSSFSSSLNENISDAQRVSRDIKIIDYIKYGIILSFIILFVIIDIVIIHDAKIVKDYDLLSVLTIYNALFIWIAATIESHARSKFLS